MSKLGYPLASCLALSVVVVLSAVSSCSAARAGGGTAGSSGASASDAGDASWLGDVPNDIDFEKCTPSCSADLKSVLRCGFISKSCTSAEFCANGDCYPACQAAQLTRSSIGCDYYPVMMAGYNQSLGGCFAVVVSNTWGEAATISIDLNGQTVDPSVYGFIPKGSGQTLQYLPYDSSKALQPGQVAIFFLAGPDDSSSSIGVSCPQDPFTTTAIQVVGTGVGHAFHLSSDRPVVAYQVLPFGGGSAGVTGASLLLPTSVWDTNYVALNAYGATADGLTRPTMNIVAMQDSTQVTMVPKVAVAAGPGIPAAAAGATMQFNLNAGQFAQITESAELTGSVIQSSAPIGFFGGHECLKIPNNIDYCDHAEQQIPAVKSLGSEYVAVPYRQRVDNKPESPPWRIMGVADGTVLAFTPSTVHASQTIGLGDVVEFTSGTPFVVTSQDADHPFVTVGYMTGSKEVVEGYGDPDFVLSVPPQQYLSRYVFFADPTYPESNLVFVRVQQSDGSYAPITLDCAGVLADGWVDVAGTNGKYQYLKFDLVRHDFAPQNGCDNGRHEVTSDAKFGLWVWGWGTPETTETFTQNVSYGYPAAQSVIDLNNIVVPVPK